MQHNIGVEVVIKDSKVIQPHFIHPILASWTPPPSNKKKHPNKTASLKPFQKVSMSKAGLKRYPSSSGDSISKILSMPNKALVGQSLCTKVRVLQNLKNVWRHGRHVLRKSIIKTLFYFIKMIKAVYTYLTVSHVNILKNGMVLGCWALYLQQVQRLASRCLQVYLNSIKSAFNNCSF